MITKEEWLALSRSEKTVKLQEAVQLVDDIETGKHALSGKPEEGRLPDMRKQAEKFILSVVDWEGNNFYA